MAGGRSRSSDPNGSRRGKRFAARRAAREGMNGRLRLVLAVVMVLFAVVCLKAASLASSRELDKLAEQQQTRTVALPAHRGAIVDRFGRDLAVGAPRRTVFAAPNQIADPAVAAQRLSTALRLNAKQRQELEKNLSDKSSSFTFVARLAEPRLAAEALKLDIDGVGAYTEESRTYPLKGSGAQFIGFAGVDNRGLAGVELQCDKELAGKPGKLVYVGDAQGRALRTVTRTEPVAGKDVQLTIDSDIQYFTENVLARTVRAQNAKGAVGVVMDPRTGAVLAMVNVPVVKGHKFGKSRFNDRNRVVTDIYEPGSIFKMVTVSGALADGDVEPASAFVLPPEIRVADRVVKESHERGTMIYTVREILQWSSNVGAVTIAKRMGKAGLDKWVHAFGFGKSTGSGFPGETPGLVLPLKQWSDSSIGNIPMGQGIGVTPLQMASAVSVIANDGVAVPPRLVAEVGDQKSVAPQRRRVISTKVAREVRSMLTTAVDAGTGQKARISGYKVAGKTGTSEKPLANGRGYSKYDYIASFAGMVPAGKPRLVILVAVDSPRASIYGGDVAAPAVQKIMSFSLQHLKIAP